MHIDLSRDKIFPHDCFLSRLFLFLQLSHLEPKLFSDSFQLIISVRVNSSFRRYVIPGHLIQLRNYILFILMQRPIKDRLVKILPVRVVHVLDLHILLLSAMLICMHQHHFVHQVSHHFLLFLGWLLQAVEWIVSDSLDCWQFCQVKHFSLSASVWDKYHQFWGYSSLHVSGYVSGDGVFFLQKHRVNKCWKQFPADHVFLLRYNNIDLTQETVPGHFLTFHEPKQRKVLLFENSCSIFNHLIHGNQIRAIIVRIHDIFLRNCFSIRTALNDVVNIDFNLFFLSKLWIERRSQIKLA